MTFRMFAAPLLVLLAACASAPSGGQAQAGLPAGDAGAAGSFLYATNQDDATVSVIDMASLEVVETVDLQALGFGPEAKPHHVVVEPDGSHWYVSLIGANTILKLDRQNRIVGRTEFEVPGMLALHATEDILYAARSMSAVNPPRRIGVVDRTTMEADELNVFFPRPHALAVGRDAEVVYTASLAVNQLAAVFPEEEDLELVDLEGPTHTLVQFALSPDGRTLVATGEMTAILLVFDVSDPASPALVTTVDVGRQPWHPVFTSEGATVWFGNKGSNTVSVVDASTWKVVETIQHEGIVRPHGSAVSPDGRYVFISSNGSADPHADMPMEDMEHEGDASEVGGTVTVFDAATRQVVKVIPTGTNTTGLGAPAGR